MRALIDADILIYEVASLCETSVAWPYGDDDVLWTRHAHIDEARARLEDSIAVLMDKVEADTCMLAVTPKTNWRFDVWGDYKANRSKSVKPMLVAPLRDYIANDPRGKRIDRLEGDDLMGIAATHPKNGADQIIVTIDKDLKTIPGNHYDFRAGKFFTISEGEANMWHLRQTLEGDRTDNYPGCPGIGKIKAEKLIADPVESEDLYDFWHDVIVPQFEAKDLDEDYALAQAQVAHIMRFENYNLKTGEVTLWTP